MIIRDSSDLEAGLAGLLAVDPALTPLARLTGPLPLRLSDPGFAGLAHIIVSQMVSRASANAIWARIVAATGEPVTSEAYLALAPDVVAALGLSRAKAAALEALAKAIVHGDLDPVGIAAMPAEAAIARLVGLRGIGLWTAEVYLMFCGGHPDIFPAGDVALRIAVGAALALPERPDIARTGQIAARWQPWRSVAARLFWAFYALKSGRNALPVV